MFRKSNLDTDRSKLGFERNANGGDASGKLNGVRAAANDRGEADAQVEFLQIPFGAAGHDVRQLTDRVHYITIDFQRWL